jgi:hypothetical protein
MERRDMEVIEMAPLVGRMEVRPLLPPPVKPFGFGGLGNGDGMEQLWEVTIIW